MKDQLISELLGGIAIIPFLVAVFYAFVGATLNTLLKANQRDVHSDESPMQFSYKFLIQDNWKKIMISLILIFIAIRFSQEVLGQQLTTYLAFLIGFSVDKLAGLIKKLDNK